MIAFVEHNTSHEHKQLLHKGFHLVEHQHSPHALHGAGALVAILLVVHFVAIGFIAYLFLRSAETTPAAKRRAVKGREMEMQHNVQPPTPRPIRCVADGPSAAMLWQR